MSTYYIWTVGCQVNVADSGKLAAGLRRLGWEPTDAADHADFIVLNTCAVRQQAEDKAANKLESIKFLRETNPDLRVAVMGCTVGPRTEELEARFPFVDVFAQPQQFDKVISVLDMPDDDTGGEFWPSVFPDGDSKSGAQSAFAYVPVIEGCDKFCTYCIVPLRRGRERSRPIMEVRREVEAHAARGVREVTLLGQTVEAYGKDQPAVVAGTAHADLFDLMQAIHDVEGLSRIRQLTSYPPDMTDRILEGMAALPKVCESFSLPVQAGDDDTLAAMRRGYTVSEFVNRVEKIRHLMPEVGISTDVIVGFPGETEAQFQNTLRLLEELRFDKVHVAAYSTRAGTFAAKRQPDDVPQAEKMERLHAIEEMQKVIAFEINHELWGRTLPVLVEGTKPSRDPGVDQVTGRTRTAKLVHFNAASTAHAMGDLVDVRITQTHPWSLRGEVVPQAAPMSTRALAR